MNHDAIAALPTGGQPNPVLVRTFLTARVIYTLADAEDPTTLTALDPSTGAIPKALSWNETLFWYDSTDTTSVHDGVTVLVTADGKRYKANLADLWIRSVISAAIATPPGSPVLNDAYIVAAAATGTWAGHDTDLAIYTGRGWQFRLPTIGELIYDEATDGYLRYTTSGAWVAGTGAGTYTANSIPASALIGRPVRWNVVNQTTNAPPGSPSTGDTYIVGPAPTGAWAAQQLKIAICEDGATFTIYTPRIGEVAYDLAQGKEYRFNGTAWVGTFGAWDLIATKIAAGDATIDFVHGTGGVILDDTYDRYRFDLDSIKVSADDSAVWIRAAIAGPTWKSGTDYDFAFGGTTSGGSASNLGAASQAQISLTASAGSSAALGSAAGESLTTFIEFSNPESTDLMNYMIHTSYSLSGAAQFISYFGGARNRFAGPVVGIRFLCNAAVTLLSGRFTLSGLRKS